MVKRIVSCCFSATGTTEKCVSHLAGALADKLGAETADFNFTLPSVRSGDFIAAGEGDLVIFGMPTYAGRLPNLLLKYLETINGGGALAVPLVTFGNRSFDNSLSELKYILETHGFKPVGAAAVSCEHSFSLTLGQGRPDEDDLKEIENFAGTLAERIGSGILECPAVTGKTVDDKFGGYYQPRDRHGNPIDIRKVKPLVDESKCLKCGFCAENCSLGSIEMKEYPSVTGICMKCCRCVKGCPAGARYYEDAGYIYHKEELEFMCGRRAENSFF